MNKRLLTEMTDEELMELERLLVRSEAALRQTKPMTEMEVGEEILRNADEWSRNFANGFALGIRFAEKHHGIGKSDDKQG